MTFPDGSREGVIAVAPVNSSRVPMPPPMGMQPHVIVTIQPADAHFDPPARMTLPKDSRAWRLELGQIDNLIAEIVDR